MEILYHNPGIEAMIESIMDFQTEGESRFWTEPLYHFYPSLDREYTARLSLAERTHHIESVLRNEYGKIESALNEKTDLYNKEWQKRKPQITQALSDAFELDCGGLFNDLVCDVSMNPVSPRFLQERRFEVFWLNSERGAIGVSIHEMIHFVWFHVWNRLFGDDYSEYERPSMKWIFSEMVVESIMRDERLSSINPYFPREHGGCVYPYFFDMKVKGSLILDLIEDMYNRRDIKGFMRSGYGLCLENEAEIRHHIQVSEAS